MTTGSAPIAAALAGAAGSAAVGGRVSPSGTASRGMTELCQRCDRPVDPSLPYCPHCGARLDATLEKRVSGPRLSVLDDEGHPCSFITLDRAGSVVGRADADIRFDDVYLSPLHARFELRDGELWVRDLGSRNGTWCYLEGPTRLSDGDVLLIGSQVLRFRRLGYPGPHPRDSDATRRIGSMVPSADVAVLEQLRADGSVRDSCHLSPARTIMIGRESGDWVFPYDPTMSGRHAEIRSEDAEFFVHDAGSRNGVALAVHGDRMLQPGQRVLLGDQVLRVESI